MSTTTTQSGVVQGTGVSEPILMDAEDAFLDRWTDKDSPSETSEQPEVNTESQETEDESTTTEESNEDDTDPNESTEEDDEDDAEEESEEGAEDEKSEATKTLDDDAEVEIKVDDTVKKVSVKELKRLWGQEAALTRKSQEVAAKRKEVEHTETKLAASLDKLYQKAVSKWEPYSKIDMLVASKQLDADQFAQLRQEAQAAYEEFRFVSEEADAFVKQTEQARQENLKVAATEALKVLKEAIPNWNSGLYDSIRDYAISNGMNAEVINNLVDPVAIQLIHKARLYDESKKVVTKKKVMTPKKVVKSTQSSSSKDYSPNRTSELAMKARSTGDMDDVANLFMSRWQE